MSGRVSSTHIAIAVLGAMLLVAGHAHAQRVPPGEQVRTDGPVSRYGTSATLHCHAWRRGDREGVFFGESSCVTAVAVDGVVFAPGDIPGAHVLNPVTARFTPIAQQRRGAGTSSDPYLITTTVKAGPLRITQVDAVRRASPAVTSRVTVVNTSPTSHLLTLFRAADCYAQGRDEGFGQIAPGRTTACLSSQDGRAIRLVGADGPDGSRPRVIQGTYEDVWMRIASHRRNASTYGFGNTCRCNDEVDNALGLQWSLFLRAGAQAEFASTLDIGASIRPGSIARPPQTTPGGRPFVALGDSFSSGEGAGEPKRSRGYDYFPDTDRGHNRCHRSRNAYPVLLTQALGLDTDQDLDFRACSGATIASLRSSGGGAKGREAPQLDALGDDTRWVTMTIGGNDAGFSRIVALCLAPGRLVRGNGCDRTGERRARAAYRTLSHMTSPNGFAQAYRDIALRVRPDTTMAILGYPDFAPFHRSCITAGRFSYQESRWFGRWITRFNGLIARRAAWAGMTYVDVNRPYRSEGSPHRVCHHDEWVNGLRVKTRFRVIPVGVHAESFHPNKMGHRGMFAAALPVVSSPKVALSRTSTRIRAQQVATEGERHSIVLRPGVPHPLAVSVQDDRITVVSVQHGDIRPSFTLRDPEGRRVALVPVPVDRPDWAPRGGSLLSMDGMSAVQIRGVTPGDYQLLVTIPMHEPAPGLVSVTTTDIPDEHVPPSVLITGSMTAKGQVRLSGAMAWSDAPGPLRFRWDLGDGTVATTRDVRHRYRIPGRYRATLTVSDSRGSRERSRTTVDTRPTRFASVRFQPTSKGVKVYYRCLSAAFERCDFLTTVTVSRPRTRGQRAPVVVRRNARRAVLIPLPATRRGVRVRVRVEFADRALRPTRTRSARWVR